MSGARRGVQYHRSGRLKVAGEPGGARGGRAEALLRPLVREYLTPHGEADGRPPGMLLHNCYNLRAGWDTDHEIVWGEYFLLESLRAWMRLR